jgi:hypothetical protein
MKQLISLVVLASFFHSAFSFAAVKKSHHAKKDDKHWNEICQGLLDNSVKSTLKLEKSVRHQKKISKQEVENKIQSELLVVQLNAWVCALSAKNSPKSDVAEQMFLQDYSEKVQKKKM